MPRFSIISMLLISQFIVCQVIMSAQPGQDSLFSVWKDQTLSDTVRLTAFDSYIRAGFMHSQPDSAIRLADEMISYAKSAGNLSFQARGVYLQGNSSYILGDYFKALSLFSKSEELYRTIGDLQAVADIHNNTGLVYKYLGDYVKALHYYQLSLDYKIKNNDVPGILLTHSNIGVIYNRQENYKAALRHFQMALGMLSSEDKLRQAMIYGNMGNSYMDLGIYDTAQVYFTKATEIFDSLGYTKGLASAINNLGNLYSKKQDYKMAETYYFRSLAIKDSIGDVFGTSTSNITIGRNYYDLEQYQEAIRYCLRGLEIAKRINGLDARKDACKCLYDSHKKLNNNSEALAYYEVLQNIEDSLNHEQTSMDLQKMEFSRLMYEDSIANVEKARLVEEAHQAQVRSERETRNWSIAGGVFALLLAGGFFSRWRYIRRANQLISKEKERSDSLLHNILPAEVAAELKEKGESEAKDFEQVTVLFTDFVEFTQTAARLSAKELVGEINACFKEFDSIVERYDLEKIKTIGDAYMAAGGLHRPRTSEPVDVVKAALEMQDFINLRHSMKEQNKEHAFRMRVGIHTGPVVAGIVGVKKFQYDIWGDTVNIASRMESHGEAGRVNISGDTYDLLKEHQGFRFESRGMIQVKGKGEVAMYYVSRA